MVTIDSWEADFSKAPMAFDSKGENPIIPKREGYASESDTEIFGSGKTFWLDLIENRDSDGDFCPFGDGKREEIETLAVPVVSRRASETLNLQKWENSIRVKHDLIKDLEKKTGLNETNEIRCTSQSSRPVVTLNINSSKPITRPRRSLGLGDITNSLKTTSLENSKDFMFDFSGIIDWNSRPKFGKLGNSDIKSYSTTEELTKPRRTFGLEDFMPFSTRGTTEDHMNVSNPERIRRSYGLSDFVEKLDTPSASARAARCNGKETHMVAFQESASVNAAKHSELVSRNTPRNCEILTPDESKVNDTMNSVGSGEKFQKLLGMWNQQIEQKLSRSSVSPSPTSNKSLTEKTIPTISDYGDSKDLVDSDILYESKENKNLEIDQLSVNALVILEHNKRCDLLIGEARQNNSTGEQLIINNMLLQTEETECECSSSIFSGNDDLITFFLPQMGMACTCGRKPRGLRNPDDPTALENVLRPWQVEFLHTFGIRRGEDFVKARHRSAGVMARAMRQWRKKHDMTSFKTSACATALSIWSKVCKSYVRSIRRQIQAGITNFELQCGSALFGEMSQFLDDLPEGPTRKKNRTLEEIIDIEPESQVEV